MNKSLSNPADLSQFDRRIYRSDQGERFQGEHCVPVRSVHDGFGPLELHIISSLPVGPARAAALPGRLLVFVPGALSALSKARRQGLPRSAQSDAADFEYVAQTADDIEQLKLTCSVLSDILWWKTQCIRVGFLLAITCVFLTMVLLLYAAFT